MAGIKLIIFDLDGTLIDAYPAITASFNYAMQRLNYPRQEGQVIRRAVGWGDKGLLSPFVEPRDLTQALSLYRRHHQKALLGESRLFPQVKKVLRYLKIKGYRLAVASNRPTKFSWILIRHLGLTKYFDYVLCADALKRAKPHPEILNKIMRRFSLSAEDCLYVGDMVIDAQAGRDAGIKTVMVTTGSNTESEIKKEKPWRIIRRVSGLLKIL